MQLSTSDGVRALLRRHFFLARAWKFSMTCTHALGANERTKLGERREKSGEEKARFGSRTAAANCDRGKNREKISTSVHLFRCFLPSRMHQVARQPASLWIFHRLPSASCLDWFFHETRDLATQKETFALFFLSEASSRQVTTCFHQTILLFCWFFAGIYRFDSGHFYASNDETSLWIEGRSTSKERRREKCGRCLNESSLKRIALMSVFREIWETRDAKCHSFCDYEKCYPSLYLRVSFSRIWPFALDKIFLYHLSITAYEASLQMKRYRIGNEHSNGI